MKTNKRKAFLGSIFVLVALMLIVQSAMATTFSGGQPDGKFNAFYDSSVSSYGYTPHYDAARAKWNATATSVNIGKTTSTSSYPDKYYVGTATNPPGSCLLGQIAPYKLSGGSVVSASSSDTWMYSTVAIYHNSMTECVSMSYDEVVSNATHEVGHSLALAHTTGTTSASVMYQGIQSIGPTTYDKNEIIGKWGP